MFEKGIFGGMFDFDGDGELDFGEQLMELSLIQHLLEEEEQDEEQEEDED